MEPKNFPRTITPCPKPVKEEKKKSPKAQGNRFEKEVRDDLQKTSKSRVQRNHQGGPGGGISRPDISYGKFNIEAKDTEDLEIPKWLRNLIKETPPEKIPSLVFKFLKLKWQIIPFDKRVDFATQVIEELGGTVELPYWIEL